MRIAVTGATGFVGRFVVAELERLSVSPTLLLEPAEVCPPSLSGHATVEFDLLDPPEEAYDLLGRPDRLIHLAWGGLSDYQSHRHFESELPGQYRFLSEMIGSGLQHLLVTGTCLEYGMQSGSLREDQVAQPGTPYGSAKDILRQQLESLQRAEPFGLTWARLFFLFGEGQPRGSLFPSIMRAAEKGEALFGMSGGEQLRDYLHVTEVARYLVRLAMADGNPGIVNVCSGRPVSVRRIVEGWIEEYGWSIDLDLGHYPYPAHEPMAFWGDRNKLDRILERE